MRLFRIVRSMPDSLSALIAMVALTAFFSGACVVWLKGRYRELQPYVIATLMSVLVFLAILMLFAANPFRTLVSGAVQDGAEGSRRRLNMVARGVGQEHTDVTVGF
jgi:cytochrome c biogenesis factor